MVVNLEARFPKKGRRPEILVEILTTKKKGAKHRHIGF